MSHEDPFVQCLSVFMSYFAIKATAGNRCIPQTLQFISLQQQWRGLYINAAVHVWLDERP